MKNHTFDTINTIPTADSLWNGAHKIPWNDPAFSARILGEHLSQAHNLASRKTQFIQDQTRWISSRHLLTGPASILDLGCGPGLYSRQLAGDTHHYTGIDFSPASIDYAQRTHGQPGRCEFSLGDVTQADYGGPHDLVMMLYGELNVFSPANCRHILFKAYAALASGGTLLVEFQNPAAVKGIGEAPKSWTRAEEGGLFSDVSYVCLTESHWFEQEAVALQCFHVMEAEADTTRTYRSTTKAWSNDEMQSLLQDAGFSQINRHDDWPVQDDSLLLLSALKR